MWAPGSARGPFGKGEEIMSESMGSMRLSTFERIFYGIVAAAILGVLAWIGMLVASSGLVADTGQRPGLVQDRDLIVQGAYFGWEVRDACERGHDECQRMLTAVNAEAASYGLTVFEDGSVAPASYAEAE